MPYCKNDPKKKYKGDEPSPKGLGYCAHAEKEGIKKKGKDGNIWEVKKVKNGSKRWIKIKITTIKLKLDNDIKENQENLNKLLKKKQITEKNEEYIKNFLKKQSSSKKDIINKIFKKNVFIKKNKTKNKN